MKLAYNKSRLDVMGRQLIVTHKINALFQISKIMLCSQR